MEAKQKEISFCAMPSARLCWSLYALLVLLAITLYIYVVSLYWEDLGCNSLFLSKVSCESISKIVVDKRLGFGFHKVAEGTIWGCTTVVLKHARDGDIHSLKGHAAILEHLHHPNLVQLYGTCDTGDDFRIIEEYISGETLTFRKDNKEPSLEQALNWSLGITRLALYFTRSPIGPLMHCDFLHHNFVLDKNNIPILIDVDTVWSFPNNNLLRDPPVVPTHQNMLVKRNENGTDVEECVLHKDCRFSCSNGAPESTWCNKETGYCAPFTISVFTYGVCDDLITHLMSPFEHHHMPPEYFDLMAACMEPDPNFRLTMDELLFGMESLYKEVLQKHPPGNHRWNFWI